MCRPLTPDTSLEAQLCDAAGFGDDAGVEALLRKGANPNAFAKTHRSSPLSGAAFHGHVKAMQLLLAAGADPHRSNFIGGTALASAVSFSKSEAAVQLLLDVGSDVNATDRHGRNCVHLAAAAGHAAITRMMLDAGGRVDVVGDASAWVGKRPIDIVSVGCTEVAVVVAVALRSVQPSAPPLPAATVRSARPRRTSASRTPWKPCCGQRSRGTGGAAWRSAATAQCGSDQWGGAGGGGGR
jgi:hypothetical protein